jgi:hypothetical protein
MFDVPQKFYELCRLCLSPDGAKLSIFEEEGTQRNFAEKILTCLSIAVSVVVCNRTRFIGRDHLCYSRRLCVCVSLSASFPQCRAFSLSLSRLLAHSLALLLVCPFVRRSFRSALARSTARLSQSLLLTVSLWPARLRVCDHPRARESRQRERVYVRVPREKVWQEMCPRDKPTSSSGI